MAWLWTRRGRALRIFGVIAVVAGVVAGVLIGLGKTGVGPLASEDTGEVGHGGNRPPPPKICPLTGVRPKSGKVPDRPAVAVKVENLPSVRPQWGLDTADLVYEEPVESGITRFIAIYQCGTASRVEPVRSARFVDVDVLVQFDRPVFGYAGGIAPVLKKIREAPISDVNFIRAAGAYQRDPDAEAPHNLFTSTPALLEAARSHQVPPDPLFQYSEMVPSQSPRIRSVHIPFSSYSDVWWRWSRADHAFLRFYDGDVAATAHDGHHLAATNVVVQMVRVAESPYVEDVNGAHQLAVTLVGRGEVLVLRNGRLIRGEWVRKSLSDKTTLVDRSGKIIRLMPGSTWIELVPSEIDVVSTKS